MDYKDLKLQSDAFANPRKAVDRQEVTELALSIGRLGLLNRLIVTPSGLVIGGQRRYLAIGMVLRWRDDLEPLIGVDEHVVFQERANSLLRVPVDIRRDPDIAGIALADNIMRADLTSYEIASHVAAMTETRSSAEVSRMIGKSPTWVSRHRTAYHQSGARLRAAWQNGELPFDQVLYLAAMPIEEQERALASDAPPPSRAVRGPAGRPGIEDVKAALEHVIEQRRGDDYAKGVFDALTWVTRSSQSARFSELLDIPQPLRGRA
jgi:hypothetical protein